MRISFIIVNYGTHDDTINCIKSIFRTITSFEYEVVLVINPHPEFDSFKVLNSKYSKVPNIKIIQNEINLGFAAGCNIGIKNCEFRAEDDYLFFINPDITFKYDILKNLDEKILKIKTKFRLGVIGFNLLNKQGITIEHQRTFPHFFGFLRNLLGIKKPIKLSNSINIEEDLIVMPVDYITGADFLIKRNLFLKELMFDEKFFVYYEEVDFQKRLSKNGYTNVLIQNEFLIHEGGVSLKNNRQRSNDLALESLCYYFEKHRRVDYYLMKLFLLIYSRIK